MAKLTSQERNSLSTESFAIPKKRKYPIENKSHARNALSRVSANGTPEEKAKVKKAVKEKFPSIGSQHYSTPMRYHGR